MVDSPKADTAGPFETEKQATNSRNRHYILYGEWNGVLGVVKAVQRKQCVLVHLWVLTHGVTGNSQLAYAHMIVSRPAAATGTAHIFKPTDGSQLTALKGAAWINDILIIAYTMLMFVRISQSTR